MRNRLLCLIIICGLLIACGRKAVPHLKAFEKPQRIDSLRAIHNERGLIISWSYPEKRKVEIKGFIILRAEDRDFERRGYVDGEGPYFLFIDSDPKAGKTYSYRVFAESTKGIVSDVAEINVTPSVLPEPPKDIRFSIKNDFIELKWDDKRTCYNIYRAYEGEGYSIINNKPICEGVFIDRAIPERPVHYIVRSVIITDIANEGPASKEITVRMEDYIPSPPSDLSIVAGKDKVFLLWKESPEVWVRGYRIYRKVEGERDFRIIGESTIPAFTDPDAGGLVGKRIYYMLKALGPVRESEPLYGTGILPHP